MLLITLATENLHFSLCFGHHTAGSLSYVAGVLVIICRV